MTDTTVRDKIAEIVCINDGSLPVDQHYDAMADAILAALPELTTPPWQPIETAPKDKSILIYGPELGSCEAWFETEKSRWYFLDGRNLKEKTYYYSDIVEDLPCLTYATSPVTHWMPLPAAPALVTQGGE